MTAGSLRARVLPRRLTAWLPAAALAALVVYLLPATRAVLRGDDSWNSEYRGELLLNDDTLLGSIGVSMGDVLFDVGRPEPLAVAYGPLVANYLGDHPVLYRLWIIALTAVAAWLLYRLARALGASGAAAALVVLLVASAVQFRDYHDPVTGYYGLVQIVLIALLASLLLFLRWLREGGGRLLAASFACALVALAAYEVAYPLVAAHLAVALMERRGRAALRAAAPFLALGAGFVALALILRQGAEYVSSGYAGSYSLWPSLRTYVIQLFPPLPGSLIVFDTSALAGDATAAELLGAAWRGLLVAVAVGWFGLRYVRDPDATAGRLRVGALAGLGAALYLLPPILLSVAEKYQQELDPGRGYLPVLIQVFGWGCIATAGLVVALRSARARSLAAGRVVTVAAAGLLGLAAGVVGFSNLRLVALDQPVVETRALLETAVERDVLRGVPEGSGLLFHERDLNWPSGSWRLNKQPMEQMIIDHTGRRFDGRILPLPADHACDQPQSASECKALPARVAWVRATAHDDGGSVIVAPVAPVTGDLNGAPLSVTARELFVYVEPAPAGAGPALSGADARGQPWSAEGIRWTRMDGGDGWALFRGTPTARAPVASTLADPRSRVDFTALPPPSERVRLFGTKQLLP